MMRGQDDAVAIVGYGGVFPGAEDLNGFWKLVERAVDGTGPVPPDRWIFDPGTAYDPAIPRPDRVYSVNGGFCHEPRIDLKKLRIDARLLQRLDPVFKLAIHAAQTAWQSAHLENVDPSRVGVIFGQIVLPTEYSSRRSREDLTRPLEKALGVVPASESQTDPHNAFPAGLPAALVARALGLGGPAFTLDAACASTLYALKLSVDQLLKGRVDAMLSGGVSRPDPLYTQMGFSQLKALSARGKPAPFDEQADGLVVGEGAGLFVLKRLSDALRDGDTIHAVIRGIGLSNDLDGDLLAPSSEGQLRAMRSAYAQAGWSPTDVDLIECHATGTPVGDTVEVESLKSLWRTSASDWTAGQCVIGSVKSNVGHLLTAAGAAGLLKLILAFRHQVKPATANQLKTAARLKIESSPFRVTKRGEPWPRRNDRIPRRAALSGFGFGGINAHVLLEELTATESQAPGRNPSPDQRQRDASSSSARVAIVGLATRFGGCGDLKAFQRKVLGIETPATLCPPGTRWNDDGSRIPSGHFLEPFELRVDQFRIPPRELTEMLPQQSLMLKVAADAIEDAGLSNWAGPNSGVVIGLGLDQNTNNYELRWWFSEMAPRWNLELSLGLSPAELEDWTQELLNAAGPPLTANRTMGSLGGVIASRVAREFRLGGPSFSVSCDEGSGIEALKIAADWLTSGELETAIVGAVDLAGDARSIVALEQLGRHVVPGEGAVAVVVKRLDDAIQAGNRIYAVLSTSAIKPTEVETLAQSIGRSIVRRSRNVIGHTGAASGLAAVASAATCLHFQTYPTASFADSDEATPEPWLINREDGPRTAIVDIQTLGGSRHVVRLEEPIVAELTDRTATVDGPAPTLTQDQALFCIEANQPDELTGLVNELLELAEDSASSTVQHLAVRWWARRNRNPQARLGLAVIADHPRSLIQSRERLLQAVQADTRNEPRPTRTGGVMIIPPGAPFDAEPRVAFVYPGMGNVFPGMGRELATLFPSVLRQQGERNHRLRDQFQPDIFWNNVESCRFDDHRALILGQVSVASLVTDILRLLGVKPHAAVGYSMGESSALVALGAWNDRDELTRRLMASPLFQNELAGSCHAARRAWCVPNDQPIEWVAGIVACSMERVEAAIGGRANVYVLIKNAVDETVIGGEGNALREVVKDLGVTFLELPAVSTVHCPVGSLVETDYRKLHDLPTQTPADLDFYSGIWKRAYRPNRSLAADAITAQASQHIDFPAVVEQAYEDGVRIFIETGPGSSCTRLIDRILADRPHLAFAACVPQRSGLESLLELLGRLVANRVEVNLECLYGRPTAGRTELESPPPPAAHGRTITIQPAALPDLSGVLPPVRSTSSQPASPAAATLVSAAPDRSAMMTEFESSPATQSSLEYHVFQGEAARAEAHAAFLRVSADLHELMAGTLESQFALIERLRTNPGGVQQGSVDPLPGKPEPQHESTINAEQPLAPMALKREQCLEFAVGSIAAVLGPMYRPIDDYPTRVRLPDEPLMLVDRIVLIEGEPRSLTSGRVVTEHDILEQAWYLDAGRIPPCIAIESGQADLFLSGFLGIDFETRGEAVYRLLDATVTFHRGLPGPGEVIRYDIRITRFFRQGETHLFRFEFDGTVNGEPLLTMRDGCAGFFTLEELNAGKGIVPRPMEIGGRRGKRPQDWRDLTPPSSITLSDAQVDALRQGDLGLAFGEPFDRIQLADPLPLPGSRMTLVHRVERLDPQGGRFGLGLIRAEADIHPDDWFMVCHFVDDRVMPGTLMYECCLHTLRIFLMRLGWVGARDRVAFEPLPGVANRLRCRGQVIESTRKVTYEIEIKELGYGPEPFAIADALMYADGRPIVEITDMAIRLSGTNRAELEDLWERTDVESAAPVSNITDYGRERILAFAAGKPSEGFGERYRPFDSGRFIARLPAPPYSFLDRVSVVQGQPWEMVAETSAHATYVIPADAWYFEADRHDQVPYAVLLEAALQACGWVSAYMGSALQSDGPLKFRNLGGTATQHIRLDRNSGKLSTLVTATKITKSAGMIIQEYDFAVQSAAGLVMHGETSFGFFHPDALAAQVGIRDASGYELPMEQRERARSFPLPDRAPYPDRRWRMIDQVDTLVLDGGPHGLGVIEGSSKVHPDAWFFQAHFVGDPVWPGSLGLESFLQLLRVIAVERWGGGESSRFDSPGLGQPHRWLYRGQIVPSNSRVTVQAIVTAVDDGRRELTADGHLAVEGLIIYQMKDFRFRLRSD